MQNVYHLLASLEPNIQLFIQVIALLGPASIVFLIILLKRIEKKDPNKIRWR